MTIHINAAAIKLPEELFNADKVAELNNRIQDTLILRNQITGCVDEARYAFSDFLKTIAKLDAHWAKITQRPNIKKHIL